MMCLAGSNIDSAFVAIFWLSDDYMEVVDYEGQKEFNQSDLIKPDGENKHSVIEPGVMHGMFPENKIYGNRGRIGVYNGVVELWVGEECPNDATDNIKAYFGISKYKVKVMRDVGYDADKDGMVAGSPKDKIESKVFDTGLFWFNNDFTEITRVEEVKSFDENDMPKCYMPHDGHFKYDGVNYLNKKRGRVVIEDGRVVVYLGENAREPGVDDRETKAFRTVKDYFRLSNIRPVVIPVYMTHWNGEGKMA